MGFGLGALKLSPAAFWAMTPREMAAAIRAVLPDAAGGFGKTRLEALMRRYPDA
jgi:uncharacterized phage protein (TIGR02216 family)